MEYVTRQEILDSEVEVVKICLKEHDDSDSVSNPNAHLWAVINGDNHILVYATYADKEPDFDTTLPHYEFIAPAGDPAFEAVNACFEELFWAPLDYGEILVQATNWTPY